MIVAVTFEEWICPSAIAVGWWGWRKIARPDQMAYLMCHVNACIIITVRCVVIALTSKSILRTCAPGSNPLSRRGHGTRMPIAANSSLATRLSPRVWYFRTTNYSTLPRSIQKYAENNGVIAACRRNVTYLPIGDRKSSEMRVLSGRNAEHSIPSLPSIDQS